MTRFLGAARGAIHPALGAAIALAGCSTAPPPSRPDPAVSATPGGACPVQPQAGPLRTNTLVDVQITSDGLSDRVTFTLGEPASEPTGSTGRLQAVEPPFAQGGSGLPVSVASTRFVELHLDGMAITDDAGVPTYVGLSSVKPEMLALRHVQMTEAFEGVYNFVIGYDGNGCVGLIGDDDARTLTLTIGH